MWRALRSPGLSSLGHTRRATQRNEAAILQRKNKRWPTLKEGWAEGRTIVFIYESALTERHTRVKTRAPKGQAQMMHYQIICKRLSLLADATVARFLSGFFHGAIELPRQTSSSRRSRARSKASCISYGPDCRRAAAVW